MEPDVLATTSEAVSRAADWATRVPPSASAVSSETVGSSGMSGPSPSIVHGNGTNGLSGHTMNGHASNGNGHAHARFESGVWMTALAPSQVAPLSPAVAHLPLEPISGLYLRQGKRMLDVVGALMALVISAPVLLIAAIAIKLESRGPVFYRSTRIGRGGRPFTFYKLRSMVNGADRTRHHLTHLNEADGPVFKINGDPRVTRVGRLLRTTSIDEIPQFFHVLSGEMSLVGPRPPLPDEVNQYEPWQLHRLDVRPGLTCLWQISGRSRIGFQEWMRLDLEYIRRRSLLLDVMILLRTIPAVLSREGAY